MSNLKCVWEIPATLGEGPLWAARDNAIYWVDIGRNHVHRLGHGNGVRRRWRFDTAVTSLAMRRQGGFVGTVRHGFVFVHLDTSSLEPISLPEASLLANRFNDGKVDAHGRFWAGSMHEDGKQESGSLFSYKPGVTGLPTPAFAG